MPNQALEQTRDSVLRYGESVGCELLNFFVSPRDTMNPYDRFHALLKRDFVPLLRGDGFKGSGTTFRRLNGDAIHVVNIQGSQSGGQCCVNLGLHYLFLPSAGGSQATDAKKLREYECEFRDRVHEAHESDRWWSYGTTDAESEFNVANLIDLYRRRGVLFFGAFDPFPGVFQQVSPADIDSGDLSKMPGRLLTKVRAALVLARIMKHLGSMERCREFAEVGLRHVGQATALKNELQALKNMG